MYRLRTFGRLALLDTEGRTLEANTKPLVLLTILALPPNGHLGRDYLSELIWPGPDRTRARKSLRQALSHLNKHAPGLVHGGTDPVAIDRSLLSVDFWELESAMSEERFAEAVAAYGGPFLSECRGRVGRELEQWIQARQDTAQAALEIAIPTAVAHHAEAGEVGVAADLAQRLVELNPLSERARLGLVDALDQAGDPVGALLSYQEYVTLIRMELGDEPGAEIRTLAEEIRRRVDEEMQAKRPVPEARAPEPASTTTVGHEPAASGAPGPSEPQLPGPHAPQSEPTNPRLPESDLPRPHPEAVGGRVPVRLPGGLNGVRLGALLGSVALLGSMGWLARPRPDAMKLALPVYWDGGGIQGPATLTLSASGPEADSVAAVGSQPLFNADGWAAVEVNGPRGVDIEVVDPAGRRTTLLAESADERAVDWSPDGQFLLIAQGWVDEDGAYQRELRVADLAAPGTSRPLGVRPGTGDFIAAWSPDGSTIAVAVETGAGGACSLLLIDPAGSTIATYPGEPNQLTGLAWSPDGTRLAFVSRPSDHAQDIHLVEISTGTRSVLADDPGVEHAPRWLSDRHLIYVLNTGGRRLPVIRTLDSNVSYLLDIPGFAGLRHHDRSGSPPQTAAAIDALLEGLPATVLRGSTAAWVDSISISGQRWVASPGEWIQYHAGTYAADGDVVPSLRPLDWSVGDSAVATVDPTGRVRARAPGRTTLVAALPGWRADTVDLVVSPPPEVVTRPTLLAERWAAGLDSTVWIPFGDPRPSVHRGRGPLPGSGAFSNNGDQNYASGAATRATYHLGEGLTLTVWGQIEATGRLFEGLGFGFAAGSEPSAEDPGWGTTPGDVVARLDAETGTVRYAPSHVPFPDDGRWHEYALQLAPDGEAALLIDGRVQVRYTVDLPQGPLRVVVFGSALGNDVLHGPVRLYRGARYDLPGP